MVDKDFEVTLAYLQPLTTTALLTRSRVPAAGHEYTVSLSDAATWMADTNAYALFRQVVATGLGPLFSPFLLDRTAQKVEETDFVGCAVPGETATDDAWMPPACEVKGNKTCMFKNAAWVEGGGEGDYFITRPCDGE